MVFSLFSPCPDTASSSTARLRRQLYLKRSVFLFQSVRRVPFWAFFAPPNCLLLRPPLLCPQQIPAATPLGVVFWVSGAPLPAAFSVPDSCFGVLLACFLPRGRPLGNWKGACEPIRADFARCYGHTYLPIAPLLLCPLQIPAATPLGVVFWASGVPPRAASSIADFCFFVLLAKKHECIGSGVCLYRALFVSGVCLISCLVLHAFAGSRLRSSWDGSLTYEFRTTRRHASRSSMFASVDGWILLGPAHC